MEIDKNIEKIGDLKVVGWHRVPTPLFEGDLDGENNGKLYVKVVRAELEDGTSKYVCTYEGCDYTADTPATVATRHYSRTHGGPGDPRHTPYAKWTVGDVFDALADFEVTIERLTRQRDHAIAKLAEERAAHAETKKNAAENERILGGLGKLIQRKTDGASSGS